MHQALFLRLVVYHGDVAGLGSFGSLFNIELDLLAFLQVAITIALNSGEMDEHILAAFALDEAETLITVKPLNRTNYSVRHFLPPLAIENILDNLVPSEGKTKQPTDQTVSCGCSSNQRNYRYPA